VVAEHCWPMWAVAWVLAALFICSTASLPPRSKEVRAQLPSGTRWRLEGFGMCFISWSFSARFSQSPDFCASPDDWRGHGSWFTTGSKSSGNIRISTPSGVAILIPLASHHDARRWIAAKQRVVGRPEPASFYWAAAPFERAGQRAHYLAFERGWVCSLTLRLWIKCSS